MAVRTAIERHPARAGGGHNESHSIVVNQRGATIVPNRTSISLLLSSSIIDGPPAGTRTREAAAVCGTICRDLNRGMV
jgi:hypothetical protein